MIKKVMVLGCVMGLLMGMASMASAVVDNNWVVQMRAEIGGNSLANATFGVKPTSTDAYLTTEGDALYSPGTGTYGYIYSLVDGQKAKADFKAPVSDTKTSQVWDLYISGSAAGAVTLKMWSPSTGLFDNTVVLTLWDSSMTEKLYTFAPNVSGSSTAVTKTLTTLNYSGASDLNLKLVATTVPEPGSMLAMFSGLVGLVGFGIRRRK